MSTTYLKVLGNDQELVHKLDMIFGKQRAKEILNSDFIYEQDINIAFHALSADGLNSWVLRYGAQISVGSHGPLGFAVLSAPDLDTALNVLADYMIIRTTAYDAEIRHVNNCVEYVIHDRFEGALAGRWLMESAISVTQQLIETMMAHPFGNNAVIRFAHPKPSYHKELEQFYGVQCSYDASEHAVSIPASWCRIPSPLSDPSTFRSNLQKCREQKLSMRSSQDSAESVSLILSGYFNERASGGLSSVELPTLTSLAKQHNMTNRTLARKLDASHTSYKKLLEDTRREHAIELLSSTHLTIADIAHLLAYQEPANFIRAFKSWFQTTPAAWRRTQN